MAVTVCFRSDRFVAREDHGEREAEGPSEQDFSPFPCFTDGDKKIKYKISVQRNQSCWADGTQRLGFQERMQEIHPQPQCAHPRQYQGENVDLGPGLQRVGVSQS